ncbi:hypothetical protein EMCG_08041 [[Emmonsia] crescens]|uniref:Uncharacterized protein n=1 Tax=[Emmonsia] crescens TaxID=73230 RepID=A0A0G2I7P1_9EURO|nr:hypothetical protein EMCG_08041 [Emmonsia crescens UAMH 3008]
MDEIWGTGTGQDETLPQQVSEGELVVKERSVRSQPGEKKRKNKKNKNKTKRKKKKKKKKRRRRKK